MILKLLLSATIVISCFVAKADQIAIMRKSVAEKAVKYLESKQQVILFCGCCTDDKPQKVTITNVLYEHAYPKDKNSGFYRVRVHGINESTKDEINKTFDLAYAWVNVDGIAKNLAWEIELNADPCHLPFDWNTYKPVKETSPSVSANDADDFAKSFLRIKESLEASVGFKVETFETNVNFTVDKVVVEADHFSKSIVISHTGSIYEHRYTIPLSKINQVIINARSVLFKMSKDGSVMTEEFKETELTYRNFPWNKEIKTSGIDKSLLEDFKTIVRTHYSMPEKMVETNNEAQEIVEVSNIEDFFAEIGPNKHLKLNAATYYISEMRDYPETDYVSWKKSYDGYEPHIKNVQNMTISCTDTAHLLIRPRYAWVLKMENCDQISFKNIVLGHEEGGYCSGGCLSLSRSSGIDLENCSLYGSGTIGLSLEYVSDFTFNNSLIYECTYGLMQLESSNNISFTNSVFKDTKEYNLIEIGGSKNISYEDCLFENNETGSEFMPHFFEIGALCEEVSLSNCKFTNNRTGKLVNDYNLISISKCSFDGNSILENDDKIFNSKFKK